MEYSTVEMMAVAAARVLKNEDVCFVGIGAPSVACNLARLTHAPDITPIYEPGPIRTNPDLPPLWITKRDRHDARLLPHRAGPNESPDVHAVCEPRQLDRY